ncbi:protein containing DUF255, partial [mine drainage metagenome]
MPGGDAALFAALEAQHPLGLLGIGGKEALKADVQAAGGCEGAAVYWNAMEIRHLNADGTPRYTNRLIEETSPYLRQHAHNPVEWHPWGDEAFALARASGRPVHLSVGYAACHWCHVLAAES